MKKLTEVYSKLEKTKDELRSKEKEYYGLSQIARSNTQGRLLNIEIQTLKGLIKTLEWFIS